MMLVNWGKKISALVMRESRSQITWLILITVFAAVLRFYKLGEWSFWIDEIFTVNHASRHFTTFALFLQNIPPAQNWFPISVILTAQVFNLWGISELSARLVAAVIGVVTIPVLYFPVRKIFNTRIALITVLLLSVSNWHVEWSQNARVYTTLMLFYSLAFITFYFALEKDRPVFLIPFYIFLYLAASERMIALFILPVLLIYILVLIIFPFGKPAGLRVRNALIFLFPFFLLLVFQVFQFFQNGETIIGVVFDEIVATFAGKSIESPFTQATFIAFKIGIPLLSFSLFSGIYFCLKRNRPALYFLVGAVVPYAVVVMLTSFMFTEERYVLVSLPCWLVLAALGIDEFRTRLKGFEPVLIAGLLLALLADAMGANLLYYRVNNGNRRPWKQAFALVQENMHEGDLVVSTWPQLGQYYLNQDILLWEDVDVNYALKSEEKIWFVVIPDMAWYTGTEDLYWWVSHNTRMISSFYLRTVDNTNLEIYLFDPALKSIFDPWK